MNEKSNGDFTHIDSEGNPGMVNVGKKLVTRRIAMAESRVTLTPEIVDLFANDEVITKKGPVFQTAIIAGVMGAKRTHELIPMCHPLNLEHCSIKISLIENNQALIRCKVEIHSKTGVEMEALTGASIAALTIYDMCKSFSKGLIISQTKLISKSGGKSDFSDKKD